MSLIDRLGSEEEGIFSSHFGVGVWWSNGKKEMMRKVDEQQQQCEG
jgi:hypothetical protein